MDKVISLGFSQDLVTSVASFLQKEFVAAGKDLDRVAIVFGGKRPALFLKKELALRIRRAHFGCSFFSFEEFIDRIVSGAAGAGPLSDIDACYLIYELAKEKIPELTASRPGFSEFLPWAREIFSFIEQLDLEDIEGQRLTEIQKNAQIGYEVPDTINRMLEHIVVLRQAFHERLQAAGSLSRGMRYARASEVSINGCLQAYDTVLFCNPFYLHRSEERIVRAFLDADKAVLFLQHDNRPWPVLKRLEQSLGFGLGGNVEPAREPRLSLYEGFDTHSQVRICHQVLSEIADPQHTVVVLPRPETVIPLVSDLSATGQDLNVSVGYPLKRGSLYSLLELIAAAQKTRKNGDYHTRDYVRLISHPLVKNLKFADHDPSVTRVMVHKIQELLLGIHDSALSGSLFVSIQEVEDSNDVYAMAAETLRRMSLDTPAQELKRMLASLHHMMFVAWEQLEDFGGLCDAIQALVTGCARNSALQKYPLNVLIAESLVALCDRLRGSAFARERFGCEDLFTIFLQESCREMVSYSGQPLEGLQVLGFLETRSLSFKHVIILDANEGVLPQLSVYEPLIPRQVMVQLGLNRLEVEDQIQRYHFLRLLGGAEDVHIVYDASLEKEKSRFVEELVWERQKRAGRIDVITPRRAAFTVHTGPPKQEAPKTPAIVDFLKTKVYSASSLTTYLHCPLSFYFRYVLGLKEQEDLLDEPQAADIGTFLHELLEEGFKRCKGRRPAIDTEFRTKFMDLFDQRFDLVFGRRMRSDAFMLKQVMHARLTRFLAVEQARGVTEIVCLEQKGERSIALDRGQVMCTYRVDRIDRLADGSLLIIDYKSGGSDIKPIAFDRIQERPFNRRSLKSALKSFQLPLYYYCFAKTYPSSPVNACLYSLKDCRMDVFLKPGELGERDRNFALIESMLDAVIAELWDLSIGFEADDDDDRYCQFCPFTQLCR